MTAREDPVAGRLAMVERLIHAGRALLASAGNGVRFRNYTEAERCFRRAVDLLLQSVGPDHPQLAIVWERLATLYDRLGDFERAETCYLRSLAAQQAAGWPPVVCDERTLVRLARVYGKTGKASLQLAVLSRVETMGPCSCRRQHPTAAAETALRRDGREAHSA